MSGGLLEAIVTDANLLQAWLVSEARLREDPVPHAEVVALRDGLLSNLAAIGTALRSGTWEPGPLRRATIAKSDGGQRVLHIPPLVDRVAERAITAVLTVYLDPQLQPDSYGFRPGLGVEDATGALQERIADGQQWVIRTDIEDCFGSIRVEQCLTELALAVDDPAVLALVAKAARRSVGERAGIGLAQGSPLSPILVNHFLDGMEEFRSLVVDTTILRLIATRAVKPEGFTASVNGCRMDPPTRRALVEALERRLLTRVVHPIRHTPMSYRGCVEHQAVLLANALVTGGTYQPMLWR
ncbi:reverse transcriptase domain-containing protein [Nocardia salmonicida]|uniref:reverse transcriptase domain-containing protein n=1 Tax=Nocardia salmonicida TaxID=53431 RepID=UPI00372386A7